MSVIEFVQFRQKLPDARNQHAQLRTRQMESLYNTQWTSHASMSQASEHPLMNQRHVNNQVNSNDPDFGNSDACNDDSETNLLLPISYEKSKSHLKFEKLNLYR